MKFKGRAQQKADNVNLTPMINISALILMALAIISLSMKKEASLDQILQLPPVLYSAKQDTTNLEIYILPAKVGAGGNVVGDSTGLVAFSGKGSVPRQCPNCALPFRSDQGDYVPNSLTDMSGKPLPDLKIEIDEEKAKTTKIAVRPPAYSCSRCKTEISPYLRLDQIPEALKKRKKEIVDEMVLGENYSRDRLKKPRLTAEDEKKISDNIPLMIKADNKAFYGRILEVVYMAKDTSCAISKFVFVTRSDASIDVVKKTDTDTKAKKIAK
ncbi:MAG: hypothetical protein A2487_06260 [Candidatus Raymondbacteria bacterium RifOxyC12_full_50_8]|uniref:Uncharacterized protein n=1 Tax=Candidatus Raymondbacteria bacterium RIFOXYD12_FULL_49_13 TaxID=1817890 RepID=A0A1F7FCA1_UNCRA|nr:MAG: hypothetical protein A2248_03160 [Candidatus Raymondbacteria bacterium RIFOXYA2_FULL_49_16]OGJ93302.1 MAG: hypothetical protein A2350_14635 [Candidatus Raymondbacteria bacterium RifOxyB12_full_50_8]OGK04263.1 MAG: hypothetical protein A2519_18045 [Candidatus Raymondbacteria bacterium RIFOXYD12_FULL_49_13]OGK06051.1 MAG: hypothetical protein A2487_06260 [Candidatus Raymondbacteria bacterium RifOxyC12_full_50_8]OGP42454.1 MAG: hypothetical protein A2324_17195 [Candidatus Raymondbacteria b